MTSASPPLARVDINAPRYDQSTYLGRLRYFSSMTSMTNLFVTKHQLASYQALLHQYRSAGMPPVSPQDAAALWKAKAKVDAVLHPQTGKPIFLPGRLSAFVPLNIAIVLGMMVPNPSVAAVAFWQITNQSYNILLNHSNRNASNEMNWQRVSEGYAGAVAVSVTSALGLNSLVKKSTRFSPLVARSVSRFVPFAAVALAGIANVFLMRRNELTEGIVVYDAEGKEHGRSGKAGWRACSQVAASRVLCALPILTIPALAMNALDAKGFTTRFPRVAGPLNLVIITACLTVALPAAVAVFPQQASVPAAKLEPQFHDLVHPQTGVPVSTLYFNRGL